MFGVAAVAAVSLTGMGSVAQATVPGTPGIPQASTVIYNEDFQNRPGPEPIVRLTDYVGTSGQTYTADPGWLSMCNGWIAAANQPVNAAAQTADCNGFQAAWNQVQRLSYGLGVYEGLEDPTTNYAVSAYTSGAPGAGLVEFETVTNIPFTGTGRFVTFSVDVAALNCVQATAPLLQFLLVDSLGNALPAGTEINGCDSTTIIPVPAIGLSGGGGQVRVGTSTSNGSVLVDGTSVGVRMINNNGSATGNDHAFDNLRIVDSTPQLDKAFSPDSLVAGQVSTLTLTITNTDELAAKNGWSVTDALPAGLVIADDDAATTCPSGVVTAPEGGTSITATGNLDAGMESCTVTVNVSSSEAGTFTNGPGNVTTVGLNPPGDAVVIFDPEDPSLSIVKSASADSLNYTVGQEVEYSFLITNTGNLPLTNVTVTEEEFSGTGGSPTVVCPASAALLAPGDSVTCAATYVATQADVDAGEITNSATSTGTPPASFGGPPPVSPPSTVDVPSNPSVPGITVVKSADAAAQDAIELDQEITYSFLVTNTGNVTLTDVTVDDVEFTGSGDLSDVTCPAGAASLAPAATVTCTATYVVTQADVDAGSITNAATTTGVPPVGTPPVSPPSIVEVPGGGVPAITVLKTASADAGAGVGDTIAYSFLVTNTGDLTLTDVTVDEEEFSGTGEPPVVVCPAGAAELAPGATVTCTASYVVTQADVDAGEVTNSATTTGVPPVTYVGPPPVSPPSTTVVEFTPEASITVVKTADAEAQSNLVVGQEVVYSFLVTNTGEVTLTDVTVDEGEFSGEGMLSEVVCPDAAASLAPGAQVTCTATYVVLQGDIDAGSVTNTATSTGVPPASFGGPPPVSPPSEALVPAPPLPALSILKTANVQKATAVGQVVSYSFRVTNTGNVTIEDVVIVETAFTGSGTLSMVLCPVTAASLAPGAQVTCTATYSVTQADLNAGSINNTAIATGVPPEGDRIPSDPSSVTVPAEALKLASTGVESTNLIMGALMLAGLGGMLLITRRVRRLS